MGRPPRPIDEVREFGYLVGIERERSPGAQLDELFAVVQKRDAKRWGRSAPTARRLWRAYKDDREQNPVEAAAWYWRRVSEEAIAAQLHQYQTKGTEAPQPERKRRPDTGRQGLPDPD